MTPEASQPELSRRNTAGWVMVTGGAQAIRFIVTLLSTAILARLLLPADFGLIAAASPVLAFTAMLQNLGLNEALVQRPTLEKGHINALFFVLIGMSIAVSAALVLLAPVLAAALLEPRLTGIIQAMAGIGLIVAASTTPLGLMSRKLKFKQLAMIDSASSIAGLIAGVGFAFATQSYWALVLMQAVTAAVQLLGACFFAGWKPGTASFDVEFRRMIGMGAGFSTFNLLNFFSRNVDILLIARAYGSTALGYYERAYKMMLAPLWQSVTPFGRVLTPVLARLHHDAAAYQQRYFEAVVLLMIAIQPALVAALMFPDSAVDVVLGPGWSPASPIFFWLCLTALHQVQTLTLGWLFISQGRAREFAILGAVGAAVIVTSFVIGLPYGPAGVAMAYAIADILLRAPMTWWTAGRRGPITFGALLTNFLPHATAMAASAGLLATWSQFVQLPHISTLAGGICISYAVYISVLLLFPQKRRLIKIFARGTLKRLQVRAS